MSIKTLALSFCLMISLGACANRVIEKPVYIPVPSDYLADCRKSSITGNTVGDLALAYNARGVDIDRCNEDKASLRDWNARMQREIK